MKTTRLKLPKDNRSRTNLRTDKYNLRITPREPDSNPVVKIAIILVALIVILAGVVIARSSAKKRHVAESSQAVTTESSSTPGQPRYDELNGMTMAEWCKKNEKDNKDLQARQQRVMKYEGRKKTSTR